MIDHEKQSSRTLTAAGALVALAALALLGAPGAQAAKCRALKASHEPPCNPALAASPWGAPHRSSYAQGSAAIAGLLPDHKVTARHVELPGAPIVLDFSSRYDDGKRAVWGSLINSPDRRGVFKLDADTGKLIDVYFPDERETDPPKPSPGSISGAYNLLTREGRFIVPRQRDIEVFADSRVGARGSKQRRDSPIRLVKRFQVPDDAFCRSDDAFVGATMTYDGKLALATAQGMIVVMPRKPKWMTPRNVHVRSINGKDCSKPSVPTADLEQVSNSIAVDEKGGIYVVTSKRMRKIQWHRRSQRLGSAWSAPYRTGGGGGDIRLGEGSGSTPSLMGTARDQKGNRLVAITDGEDVMHLDLFYRDGIPRAARHAEGDDPRLACEHRVDFGDRDATAANSEQSVLVRGNAVVMVNNVLRGAPIGDNVPGPLRNALAALYGGDPRYAPHGVERIDWIPRNGKCRTRWTSNVSIPNGVPTMSQRAGLFYGIGLRRGSFGVRALDFGTGRSRMFAKAPTKVCPQADLDPLIEPFLAPALKAAPNYCENSFYAATEVGPNRTIYTGTFGGLTIYRTGAH
jgi:hypothetical protein